MPALPSVFGRRLSTISRSSKEARQYVRMNLMLSPGFQTSDGQSVKEHDYL